MIDKLQPFTNSDVIRLSEELRGLQVKRSELEAHIHFIESNKGKKKELSLLKEQLSSLEDSENKLSYELKYVLDYINTNGEDYAFFPDEAGSEYAVCIGHAYGIAVFRSSNGDLYYEESNGQEIGYPCDNFVELSELSELPEGEQALILRYISEEKRSIANDT